ncbi:hypothetical protein Syun_000305 [Stephania yunnanensis]|uniref:CBM20 domain-containing protein n=1 Tax=Stephania yunnanensis TaxID=152371 RepID=A0AAP0LEH9_9MAGN
MIMEAALTSCCSIKLLVESSSISSSSSSTRIMRPRSMIFITNNNNNNNNICSSRAAAAAAADKFGFFQSQDQRNYLPLIIRSLHRLYSVSSESQADAGASKDLIHSIDQSSNARVRFKLYKECQFGEQFFMVGDDASLGVWDPENAIPLEWSDGHIWTAELDVPVGKSIQFKFILKGATGKIVWQPGPDRVLQTWETKNLIVVSEDWENAEIQKIMEEELNSKLFVEEDTSHSQDESIAYTDRKSSVVAGDITMVDLKNTPDNISSLIEETRTNAPSELTISENKPYYDGNTEEGEASVVEDSLGSNGTFETKKNLKNNYDMNSNNDYDQVDYEGEPDLVPGLTSFPTPTNMGVYEAESNAVGAGDNEAESPDAPEEGKSLTVSDEGTKEEASGLEETHLSKEHEQEQEQEQEQPNQQTSDVLENDFRWGHETLKRFLANLGLF